MLEKLLLKKFWKFIRKMSLVALLLKNSNCPIHPPITMWKLAPLQIFPSFASRISKLVCGRIIFKLSNRSFWVLSRNLTRAWYVPKSSSSRNFEKSPFNWSTGFVRFWKQTPKFLKGDLKLTENFQEVISNGVAYQKFTNVQNAAFSRECF